MKRRRLQKGRLTAFLVSAALMLGALGCTKADVPADLAGQEDSVAGGAFDGMPGNVSEGNLLNYGEYLEVNQFGKEDGPAIPDSSIVIPAADYQGEEDSQAYITDYMGRDACLYWDKQGGSVTWDFEVEEAGFYRLALTYCAIAMKNYDIVMDILLDGEVPFENSQNVGFRRLFLDETYFGADDHEFKKDLKGNELRPALAEQFDWQTALVYDAKAEYPEPLYFYLSKGAHTITLRLKQEALAVGEIAFLNLEETPSYTEKLAQWDASGASDSSGFLGEYEAEASYLKNDITLFATYDTANEHVTPASATAILYNTIGKNTWKEIGQEISWEVEVPQDGYYQVAFKVKQYDKKNAYSVRNLTVDGEVLYQEMAGLKFPNHSKWYIKGLESAEGEALKIYLTAGRHVLGLTVDMDEEMAEVLRGVRDVTEELQRWYREIISITGFNADSSRISIDSNRDFNLEKNIPGLLDGLEECRKQLESYYEAIENMEGISTSSASVLRETAVLLESMIKRPGKIAKRIETFRGDISNLATWAIDMKDQPLTMDKFYVYSPDVKMPKIGSSTFRQLGYRFRMFVNSFFSDTNSVVGSGAALEGAKTLRVWISTADITTTGASSGRDQAIILKKLIDESFTAKSGVNVEVSLVGGSDTLVQAVLAGEGPDVSLFTSVDTPVNLAMRGALLELSQFDGFWETMGQFTESAYVPFRYKDGYYAFPETQNFNVLFYRTDVYKDLGIQPPKTWEEFYEQVIMLANNNYMVGVPQNQNTFETFLYQAGETFYNKELTKSTFHTNEALWALGEWTGLYTKYSLSLIFDFFNRFRSGEMALAIEPYNQVNYLYSAAPELDGLWDIAVLPGTKGEDGRINNVETSSSTGAIILADTKYPEEAYEFLQWWVSAETQGSFGVQVEQTLGVAARYGTANLEAFEELPWSVSQAEVIRQQRGSTVAVEQIPGSYYIARNLSFAFRNIVYNKANLRETLYKYNIEINKELERKQKEFSY